MPTLNLKIIPVPPAIFLGDFADLNSFRRINPDAPPKEGLEASEGHIEGHEGRPSKRGASWSLCLSPHVTLTRTEPIYTGSRHTRKHK